MASRSDYTIYDDQKMCKFLLSELEKRNNDAKFPCGNQIWKLAVKRKIITKHTFQSLRDHMRRVIMPNLETMPLPQKDIQCLIRNLRPNINRPNTSTKRRKVAETNLEETDDDEEAEADNDEEVIIVDKDSTPPAATADKSNEITPAKYAEQDPADDEMLSDDDATSLIARVLLFKNHVVSSEKNPKMVQEQTFLSQTTTENGENDENVPVEDEEIDESSKNYPNSDNNLLVRESPSILYGDTQPFDLPTVSDSQSVENEVPDEDTDNDIEEEGLLETLYFKEILEAFETTADKDECRKALQKLRILIELGKKYKINVEELAEICPKFENLRELELFLITKQSLEDVFN